MPFALPASVVTAALSVLLAALFISLVPRFFHFSSHQPSRCYCEARLLSRFGCGFVMFFAIANSQTSTAKNHAKPLCILHRSPGPFVPPLSPTSAPLAVGSQTHGLQLHCIPSPTARSRLFSLPRYFQ